MKQFFGIAESGIRETYFRKSILLFAFTVYLLSCINISAASKLAPEGKEILKQKIAEYPEFDEAKYKKEAKKKFKLYKEGDEVTLSSARKVLKGTFRGVTAKSIKVGRKEMPKFDLTEPQIAKFDPKVNEKCREGYVKAQKAGYNAKKTMFVSKLRTDLAKSYPAVSQSLFLQIFKKISNKEKVKAYTEELYNTYNEKLPLPDGMSKKKLIKKIIKEFINEHKGELFLVGSYVISKEDKDKLKKAKELAVKKKEERLKTRINFPHAATPEFTPDGGFIGTEIKGDKVLTSYLSVKIETPTEGAVIHYTVDGSTPDESSPIYKKPLKIRKPVTLKAIALHDEFNDSDVAECGEFNADGLNAYFFKNINFTGQAFRKVVKMMRCDFGMDKAPFKGFTGQYFSALFTGVLIPPKTGEYEFYLAGDDGVRMWLDRELLINGWNEQPRTVYKAKKKLEAGKEYCIKVAFAAVTGYSMVDLSWKGPGIKKEFIPSKYFKRYGYYTDIVDKWTKIKGGKYIYRKRISNPGGAGGSSLIKFDFPEHREEAFKLMKKMK